MRIGVPTEIKSNEFRVGLVPGSVRELTARGHEVIVQSGAGGGIFADDADYERAGASSGSPPFASVTVSYAMAVAPESIRPRACSGSGAR